MAYTSLGQMHLVNDINPKNLSRKVHGDSNSITFRSQGGATGWSLIYDSIMWNSSARIEANEDKDTMKDQPWVTAGNDTE